MPAALELWNYWAQFPPVHLQLRAFFRKSDDPKPGLNPAEERMMHQSPALDCAGLPASMREWLREPKPN